MMAGFCTFTVGSHLGWFMIVIVLGCDGFMIVMVVTVMVHDCDCDGV